ncbi:MAG TPA: hypothetical protein VF032_06385 [Thermoleophilaceae bacterium]
MRRILLLGTLALAASAAPAPANEPVVGGTSFNDATPLPPGTSDDVLDTGDTVFYKVRLRRGQRLTVAAAANVGALDPSTTGSSNLTVRLYGPLRTQVSEAQTVGPGDPATHLKTTSAEIGPATDAGQYYVSAGLNDFLPGATASVPLPLVLQMRMDAKASRPRAAARTRASSAGTSWAVFAALCAGGVLLGTASGLLFRRR